MSVVIRRVVTPRIAAMINRASGVTEAEALARASARIEGLRAESLAALDVALEAAEQAGRADPADLDGLYDRASEVVELAGLYGLTGLGRAAYSLCDLADTLRAGGRTNAAAVAVHLEALRLLRHADDAVAAPILDGLKAVAARVRG